MYLYVFFGDGCAAEKDVVASSDTDAVACA